MTDKKRVKIGINATALLSPRTGIGQYIYCLGEALIDLGVVHPCFFYGHKWSNELRTTPVPNIAAFKEGFKKRIPNAYAVSRTLLQALFSAGQYRDAVDLYHEPNYMAFGFRGPTVTTVHDLSWIRHPETHPKDRLRAMDRHFPRSLENAKAIITDCSFVKQELVDVFGIDPSRVHPVLLGVSPAFFRRSSESCREVLVERGLVYGEYFLSVGTLEPRKNISTLLDAFSSLPLHLKERCPLVLVGMRGWLSSAIEKKMRPLVDKGWIRLLGYIPDEEMPMIYSGAAAFVFPSLYEGFGLPPLEAMACGVPVIVSNTSSLPEVVGDAGIPIEPLDVDSISGAMKRVLEDGVFASELSHRGVAQAASFSWRRTAEETTGVYMKSLRN